eukprot:scaffold9345_cov120-Cylindrotheca_fusiformis.AAC.10
MQDNRDGGNVARHPNSERLITPTTNDVLFGRGKRFQNHPGNQRMRKIIRKYKKVYASQKGQHRKRLVVENAYTEIISGGARFVKKNEDNVEWEEVQMHEALEKVAHTIRYKPRNAAKEDEEDDGDDDEYDQAANTVFMSNDDAVATHSQAQAPDISASHAALAVPNMHNQPWNPLLNPNPNSSRVGMNQIVPPVAMMDVYVNPMHRQMLQGLFPPSYTQNMFLRGLRNTNQLDFNPANANLMAALRMGDFRSEESIVADSRLANAASREEQKAANERSLKDSPSSEPEDKGK